VFTALGNNNYLAAVAAAKQMVTVDMTGGTDLHSSKNFGNCGQAMGDSIVRLEDVAESRSRRELRSERRVSGKRSCSSASSGAEANILTVAKRSARRFRTCSRSYRPASGRNRLRLDRVHQHVHLRGREDIVESLVIVTVVIFLFLGSLRAVIVPVIAMPLSLVGTFSTTMMLIDHESNANTNATASIY